VCTFLLLRGALPFYDSDLRNLYRQICEKRVDMEDKYWRNISSGAKNFILKLLDRNPKERLAAKEALLHPWLTFTGQDIHLSDTLDQLRTYNLKKKLRVAVYTLIATNKFTSLGFQLNMTLEGLRE